jgi:D-alanine-D-alanine ligase
MPGPGEQVLAKSAYESASIGIGPKSAFAYHQTEDERLREISKGLAQPVVVQRFIAGREFEVPVIFDSRPLALQPVGVSLDDDPNLGDKFLHYDIIARDKYGFFELNEPGLSNELRGFAENVFQVLGMRGFGRVDFRVDLQGKPYVTDVSTSPHLTSHSAYGFRFRADGYDTSALLAALVGLRLKGTGVAAAYPSVQN